MESGIIIQNNLSFLSRNAVFNVCLDEKEIALINKKISINIEAGIYAIQLKTSWIKTQALIVNVKNPKQYHFGLGME
jgi:hypothetical protein